MDLDLGWEGDCDGFTRSAQDDPEVLCGREGELDGGTWTGLVGMMRARVMADSPG